ncbi:MAG: T9SS type A sorting domain-containing protein [bacterium]|nr:T9SS type A sorting domain-containing protein [bacterium]
MKRSPKTITVLVILALLLPAGTAGAAGEWTSHVSASFVSDIVLYNGELYMATTGGLIIYNPSNGNIDKFTNTGGLPSNNLTSLIFDNAGSIWVGTFDSGVARLDPVSGGYDVTAFSNTFNGIVDDRITSLSAWGDSILYGTQSGAGVLVSGFSAARFEKSDGLPSEFIYDVFADGDRAWVATDSGVVFIDNFGLVQQASTGLPDPDARTFVRDDTVLWVGTANGIAWYDESGNTWNPQGLTGESVFSLSFDGQTLRAGATRYFWENDGTGWTRHDLLSVYLKYNLVHTISQIRALISVPGGDLFIGAGQPSQARGIHIGFFDGTVSEISTGGPPANNLLRMSVDIDGSVWVASTNFGVGKLGPAGKWFNYNMASGPNELSTRFFSFGLLADSQGSKWFCTPPNTLPTSFKLDELQDQLDEDYGNDVWAHDSVGDGGLDGLGSLRIFSMAEDPEGNRWMLSDHNSGQPVPDDWWGISILSTDKSAWRQVNPTSVEAGAFSGTMISGRISDVAFGPDGVTYVAHFETGVQRWISGGYDTANLFNFSDDSWGSPFAVVGGNLASDILSIALRSDGVLWVGTIANGLYKFDASGAFLNNIPANRGSGVGLLGATVTKLVLDRDENLWVGTTLGLNRIARDDDNDILSYTTPLAYQTQLSDFFGLDAVSPIVHENCRWLVMHPTDDILYIATAVGLSKFDISNVGQPSAGLQISDAYVYPNPILGGRGDSELRIANISSTVLVEIFTLEGELIHSTSVSQSEGVVWNLTTLGANDEVLASSGVYIVRISDSSGVKFQRIALLQ